jgi:hypothetical protein
MTSLTWVIVGLPVQLSVDVTEPMLTGGTSLVQLTPTEEGHIMYGGTLSLKVTVRQLLTASHMTLFKVEIVILL